MLEHLIGLNTKILENPQHYRIRDSQNDSSYYDSLIGGLFGEQTASVGDSGEGFYMGYGARDYAGSPMGFYGRSSAINYSGFQKKI